MIGIYKITNKINGHSYIGQSVNIQKRWQSEKNSAFNENSSSFNYPLSKAFRKYGIDNFVFEVIEECSPNELNQKEKYWINFYNTFYNGYNQTLGGESSSMVQKSYILGIIKDLENTDMYHAEIAQKWNVSKEIVQGINTGRYWYQENKQYPLQTKHKKKSQHRLPSGEVTNKKVYNCSICGKEITSKATLCVECAHKKSRKVNRPSLEELQKFLLNTNGNFTQAGKYYGVSDTAVRKWCKYYNIPTKSKDYKNKI